MNQNRLLTKGNAMMRKNKITLTAFALATCVSTALAQTPLFTYDFSHTNLVADGWTMGSPPFPGSMSAVNEQFVLSCNFGPANTNNIIDAFTGAWHAIPISGPLPDNQTLELRADLASVNQGDILANIHYFNNVSQGYVFGKSQNVVLLWKFWNGGANNTACVFFDEHRQITNQNVTLVLAACRNTHVFEMRTLLFLANPHALRGKAHYFNRLLALTRLGSSLEIRTLILDKNDANPLLFERIVTDTPQADPVLPNRGAEGMLSYPDPVGTPWPVLNAFGDIVLSMAWLNPTRAQPNAQAIFDNVAVWQYQYPQLSAQNAVVISWPATQDQFALESASSLSGPWALVPDPWWRTNAEQIQVSIVASDSMKFFRLLHVGQ